MFTASRNQCWMSDKSPRALFSEASTLGLGVGEWPQMIAVLDDRERGFLFIFERKDEAVARYSTKDGAFTLIVFND